MWSSPSSSDLDYYEFRGSLLNNSLFCVVGSLETKPFLDPAPVVYSLFG